jgi:YhcH/YjgK/YiaL family protein
MGIIYDAQPSFYSTLMEGIFAVFFPHDVHMPGIFLQKKCLVKKVVIKVAL